MNGQESMTQEQRPIQADDTQTTDQAVLHLDLESGELVSAQEAAYRAQMRTESVQGLIAVDALYLSVRHAIHQPLIGERGEVTGDTWQMERANSTTLRVPIDEHLDAAALERGAVTIVEAALGKVARDLMEHLFAIANDGPNWRRPKFKVNLSELLDRLGYQRDNRGVHYSKNRRIVGRTLLALQMTHIGVQRAARRPRGRSVGFVAPLLAAIGYATTEDVRNLSALEVLDHGLPEEITITINPAWYEGVRQPDGAPGIDYALIPKPLPTTKGRRQRGSRSPVVEALRAYVEQCRALTDQEQVRVMRHILIDFAGIKDRSDRQAGRTLARALDTLCVEGTLEAYAPTPIPLGAHDLVTLRWPLDEES
jgi:hypothetical protein